MLIPGGLMSDGTLGVPGGGVPGTEGLPGYGSFSLDPILGRQVGLHGAAHGVCIRAALVRICDVLWEAHLAAFVLPPPLAALDLCYHASLCTAPVLLMYCHMCCYVSPLDIFPRAPACTAPVLLMFGLLRDPV